jgi:hypothetical protein
MPTVIFTVSPIPSTLPTITDMPIDNTSNTFNLSLSNTTSGNTITSTITFSYISGSTIYGFDGFSFGYVSYLPYYTKLVAGTTLTIISFGSINLASRGNQFNIGNLGSNVLLVINPFDVPNIVGDVNLDYCFQNTMFNSNINGWKTQSVLSMAHMFENSILFNNGSTTNDGANPLLLNTSNVIYMNNMFNNASAFNQKLDSSTTYWNTSSVIDMNNMFNGAILFNNGSTKNDGANPLLFDTTNVTDMTYMFYNASKFNQNLLSWNTSLAYKHMSNMFYLATLYNSGITGTTSTFNNNYNNFDIITTLCYTTIANKVNNSSMSTTEKNLFLKNMYNNQITIYNDYLTLINNGTIVTTDQILKNATIDTINDKISYISTL